MKKLLLVILVLQLSCTEHENKVIENSNIKINNDSSVRALRQKTISDPANALEKKVQQLELEYIVWGCACANWITTKDVIKYQDSGLVNHCIFIEPANSSIEIPHNFKADSQKIIVKGQFYIREDYPRGTIETEDKLEKAKVFRYTNLKVVSK